MLEPLDDDDEPTRPSPTSGASPRGTTPGRPPSAPRERSCCRSFPGACRSRGRAAAVRVRGRRLRAARARRLPAGTLATGHRPLAPDRGARRAAARGRATEVGRSAAWRGCRRLAVGRVAPLHVRAPEWPEGEEGVAVAVFGRLSKTTNWDEQPGIFITRTITQQNLDDEDLEPRDDVRVLEERTLELLPFDADATWRELQRPRSWARAPRGATPATTTRRRPPTRCCSSRASCSQRARPRLACFIAGNYPWWMPEPGARRRWWSRTARAARSTPRTPPRRSWWATASASMNSRCCPSGWRRSSRP